MDHPNHHSVLQEFRRFYDGADVSPGNNFLTDSMNGNRQRSTALLQRLKASCSLCTELDEFIQWIGSHADDLCHKLINEILENDASRLDDDQKQLLRGFREINLFAGQLGANMHEDVREQARSHMRVFRSLDMGPYTLGPEMESTDESSESTGDGN